MRIKLYTYENCDTCRRAMKFLRAQGIGAVPIPIREQPPTVPELTQMLHCVGGDIRRLFNTSGGDYKALNMKEVLPSLATQQALELLASRGNLVKRPFLLVNEVGTVGFDESVWLRLFS